MSEHGWGMTPPKKLPIILLTSRSVPGDNYWIARRSDMPKGMWTKGHNAMDAEKNAMLHIRMGEHLGFYDVDGNPVRFAHLEYEFHA